MFNFFRRSRNQALIERIQGEIMAAARQPALFIGCGVADTVAGRFELLTLHAGIAIGHMERLPAPGPDLAQDVTDAVFRNIDIALRELGTGDVSMPKKMKKMAQGYLGRSLAYRAALAAGDEAALAAALARNVYGDPAMAGDARCHRLARYVARLDGRWAKLTLADILEQPLPQVDAAEIA